jgi:hypothetical protein
MPPVRARTALRYFDAIEAAARGDLSEVKRILHSTLTRWELEQVASVLAFSYGMAFAEHPDLREELDAMRQVIAENGDDWLASYVEHLKSPSKVATRIGEHLGDGLVDETSG